MSLLKKEESDWDIGLENGTSDTTYLNILKNALDTIFEKFKPEFIFYQAGVDVLKTDKLGHLNLSVEGCHKRDEMVINKCFKHQIPMQISMGGGYSPDIEDILKAHLNTFKIVQSQLLQAI